MTTGQTDSSAELYQSELGRLDQSEPGGPRWLAEQRGEAREFFREHGFPHNKVEAWRFTSVRPIVRVPFVPAPSATADAELLRWVDEKLGDNGAHRLVLVNGRPVAGTGGAPAGVEVLGLAELLQSAPERLEPHLGRHAATADGFAALNAAAFSDGVAIFVAKGAQVDRPLELVHVAAPGSEPTVSYPRVLVVTGPGSELSLHEVHLVREGAPHLENSITELSVGANAGVTHLRAHLGAAHAHAVAQLAVSQAKDSRYTSRVVTLGGALSRLDLISKLEGEGATCQLDGLYLVDAGEHTDHHTLVDHAVPHGSSNQKYKGVLAGTGHAVFDGTVIVRRDAQRSDAHQENRNILLSDQAVANTKPHLEIDADDVSCSHGATVGQLDEDALFYLQTRAIDEGTARAILTFAFAREMIDRIEDEAWRKHLGRAVLDRLPQGALVKELL